MPRLYDTYLKPDGSIDRASCMKEAWRIAKKRVAHGSKESLKDWFRSTLRSVNTLAGDAARKVRNASPESRAQYGYGQIDRDAQWIAAAAQKEAA
jgi:hypothetical protein